MSMKLMELRQLLEHYLNSAIIVNTAADHRTLPNIERS